MKKNKRFIAMPRGGGREMFRGTVIDGKMHRDYFKKALHPKIYEIIYKYSREWDIHVAVYDKEQAIRINPDKNFLSDDGRLHIPYKFVDYQTGETMNNCDLGELLYQNNFPFTFGTILEVELPLLANKSDYYIIEV